MDLDNKKDDVVKHDVTGVEYGNSAISTPLHPSALSPCPNAHNSSPSGYSGKTSGVAGSGGVSLNSSGRGGSPVQKVSDFKWLTPERGCAEKPCIP